MKSNEQTIQHTLGIIKPDAVKRNLVGEILTKIESSNNKIVHLRMLTPTKKLAKIFYREHKDKPFYQELVVYLSSGPVVIYVLEGKDVIEKHRKIMGKTNPKKATKNTIRALYGKTIMENSIHGSDSSASAQKEINLFKKIL